MKDWLFNVVCIAVAAALAATLWTVVVNTAPTKAEVCAEAQQTKQELMVCQVLPNCRVSVDDVHRANVRMKRCENANGR